MKKFLVNMCLNVVLLVGSTAIANAGSYNPTTEFSLTNGNPNGVWTYGWMPSDFSAFHLFTNPIHNPAFDQWYTPGMSGDYTPTVGYNYHNSPQYGVPAGDLMLHPGPNLQASLVRFTAPTTGSFNIDGQFLPGDTGQMSVGVREGGTFLFQHTDSGAFNLDHTSLNVGDTIDFVVYGGYGFGSTPLEVTISPASSTVPEPSTVMLLGGGIAIVALIKRAKKKTVKSDIH